MDNYIVTSIVQRSRYTLNIFFLVVEDNKQQSMSFLNGKTISKQATGWKLSRVQHHLDEVVSLFKPLSVLPWRDLFENLLY